MLLAGVLSLTIGSALVLSWGAANPPYAGSRIKSVPLNALQDQVEARLEMPASPFTIEASAIFPAHAVWRFVLNSSSQVALQFELYDDGTYTIRKPTEALRSGFPHLRGAGERMRVRIDVSTTGDAVLRFNNEIAWRGTLELGNEWECRSSFSNNNSTAWERFSVSLPEAN